MTNLRTSAWEAMLEKSYRAFPLRLKMCLSLVLYLRGQLCTSLFACACQVVALLRFKGTTEQNNGLSPKPITAASI